MKSFGFIIGIAVFTAWVFEQACLTAVSMLETQRDLVISALLGALTIESITMTLFLSRLHVDKFDLKAIKASRWQIFLRGVSGAYLGTMFPIYAAICGMVDPAHFRALLDGSLILTQFAPVVLTIALLRVGESTGRWGRVACAALIAVGSAWLIFGKLTNTPLGVDDVLSMILLGGGGTTAGVVFSMSMDRLRLQGQFALALGSITSGAITILPLAIASAVMVRGSRFDWIGFIQKASLPGLGAAFGIVFLNWGLSILKRDAAVLNSISLLMATVLVADMFLGDVRQDLVPSALVAAGLWAFYRQRSDTKGMQNGDDAHALGDQRLEGVEEPFPRSVLAGEELHITNDQKGSGAPTQTQDLTAKVVQKPCMVGVRRIELHRF